MTIPGYLFIAGTPKSGTSSVFGWLAAHPAIASADVKEVFHFMDEGHPLRDLPRDSDIDRMERYKARFHPRAGTRYLLDGTTHYVYQEMALERIPKLAPPAHVVMLLRDPAERVYSSFRYTKNNLSRVQEPMEFSDFVDAVEQGLGEEEARALFGEVSGYVLRRDLDYSCYVRYLVRWREALPSHRLHVFVLERIRTDPAAFMTELCLRLDLDPKVYEGFSFDRHNRTRAIRARSLHRRALEFSRRLPTGVLKKTARDLYLALQTKPDAPGRTDADEEAVAHLAEKYHGCNREVADLFDLDISAWRSG